MSVPARSSQPFTVDLRVISKDWQSSRSRLARFASLPNWYAMTNGEAEVLGEGDRPISTPEGHRPVDRLGAESAAMLRRSLVTL